MRGRVALVTGGSGGIGAALTARLREAGATVAVHYAENRAAAEQTGAPIFQADLRDPAAPDALVDAVEEQLGPIDVLAANAGLSRPASYEDVDGAAFDETLAVNLRAPFLLARRVLPGMRERGFGRVLFTSSVAGADRRDHRPALRRVEGGPARPHASPRHPRGGRRRDRQRDRPGLIAETAMLPGDPGELAARVPVKRLGTPAEVATSCSRSSTMAT